LNIISFKVCFFLDKRFTQLANLFLLFYQGQEYSINRFKSRLIDVCSLALFIRISNASISFPFKALLNTEKPEKTLSRFRPEIITDIRYNQSRKVIYIAYSIN